MTQEIKYSDYNKQQLIEILKSRDTDLKNAREGYILEHTDRLKAESKLKDTQIVLYHTKQTLKQLVESI